MVMNLKHFISITATIAVMLFAGEICLADADWMAMAKTMAEDSESSRIGSSEKTGGYVIAIAKISDSGDAVEAMNSAKIAAKRIIAGIVGGENVEAHEHFSTSESVNGDKVESQESFSSSVKIDVEAIMKGAMVLGTVDADGSKYIVLLATQMNADVSGKLSKALDDNPNTVSVIGFAPLTGDDIALAQRMAYDSAKSQAIEQVLGTTVAATDASMNDKASAKVFASSAGFIKQFRVIQEGKVGDSAYRVEVVVEVAKDELLNSYKSALESLGDVKFYVDCGDTFIREKVVEAFSGWGCNVTGKKNSAQYIIACHGSFQDVTHPVNGSEGTRCVLSIRIVDVATGREMLTAHNNSKKSVSFTGSKERRRRLSAEKTMKEIHGKIHEKLDEMIRGMVSSGRDVRLEFDNYSEVYTESLDLIASQLEKIPGCSAPKSAANTSRGTATITFRCTLDISDVKKFLGEAMNNAKIPFKPRQTGNDANSISFEW